MKINFITSLLVIFIPIMAQANSNPCVEFYKNNTLNVTEYEKTNFYLGTVYNEVCGSSEREYNLGFTSKVTTILETLPLASESMSKFGAKSNKQFCDKYEKESLSQQNIKYVSKQIMTNAHENFNTCISNWNDFGVAISHHIVDPSKVLFGVKIKNNTDFKVNGIHASGGFSCRLPVGRKMVEVNQDTILKIKEDFSMTCTREGEPQNGDLLYPAASISLGNNILPLYSVKISADNILGLNTLNENRKYISELQKQLEQIKIANDNLLLKLQGISAQSFPFYFGEKNQWNHNALGTRFGCKDWSYKPQSYWEPIVVSKFCANAAKFSIRKIYSHSGGKCGYNYFVLSCITIH